MHKIISQDKFKTMKFNKFPMIKTRKIEILSKEEQNILLSTNDEPNHEWQSIKEDICILHFLSTILRSISSILMCVALQKQQGAPPW